MKRFGPWPLCAALAILLLALGWTPMQRLDLLSYDVLAPARHPAAIDDVVVVAIDDASLARLGQWPWSRRVHAQMIDRLREGGAAAIAYDVLWVEPSADDGADRALAEAIRSDARVVLPVAPAPSSSIAGGITPLAPLNELADAARALGHVDVEVDLDGLARRVYLEAGTGTTRWTAFALAGSATSASTLPGRRAPGIDGAREASWYRDHEVLVPRIAAPLAQLAFATLLQEPAQAAALRGKTVFVGATASGLGTDLATPFSTSRTPTPAVLFHANTHVAWRDGSLITPLGLVAQLLLVLPVFVLLALWAPQYRRSRSIVVAASIALPIVLSAALLHAANVWFAPLSATIALVVGNLWWRVGQLRDAARQLFRARAQAEATLQAIADAVIRVDPQQRIDYANPVAQSMSGRQVLTGIPVGDLFDANPAHRQLVTAALDECVARRETVRLQAPVALSTPNGSTRLMRVAATPLFDADDAIEGAVLAMSDVTEAAQALARLDHAATHDALTSLPNRVYFRDRLQQAIAEAHRTGRLAAVLFIDLDRFKRINDSLGHKFGDQVLCTVAERLRPAGRANDTVARWGGDEFVVLLNGLPSRDTITQATMRLMDAVAHTIPIDGMDLQCVCSVGIALTPHDAVDADALLAMADMAMYRARSKASGRFDFYSPELAVRTRDRLALENRLMQALDRGEFELYYQPQIDLATGRPVAFEALLRWRDGSGTVLLPERFMDVAEESGLILGIGEWVIAETVRQIARWQEAGLMVLPVALNVSARQCLDHGIVRLLQKALGESGVAPHHLALEITETAAMRDVEHVIDLLKQIAALGISIAVDDFGTGYSSLAYLKRFPISQLKIDQSFVRDIGTDSNDAAIVAAIIALAHSLGLAVVAEGVETEIQRAFLAERRCDFAQGFLFDEPLRADVIPALLAARGSRVTSVA